jgi:hypothetical protein
VNFRERVSQSLLKEIFSAMKKLIHLPGDHLQLHIDSKQKKIYLLDLEKIPGKKLVKEMFRKGLFIFLLTSPGGIISVPISYIFVCSFIVLDWSSKCLKKSQNILY